MADFDVGWDVIGDILDPVLEKLESFVYGHNGTDRPNEYNNTYSENAAEIIEGLGLDHCGHLHDDRWLPLLENILVGLKAVTYKKNHPWGINSKSKVRMIKKMIKDQHEIRGLSA